MPSQKFLGRLYLLPKLRVVYKGIYLMQWSCITKIDQLCAHMLLSLIYLIVVLEQLSQSCFHLSTVYFISFFFFSAYYFFALAHLHFQDGNASPAFGCALVQIGRTYALPHLHSYSLSLFLIDTKKRLYKKVDHRLFHPLFSEFIHTSFLPEDCSIQHGQHIAV